jgi:hypothetical protein
MAASLSQCSAMPTIRPRSSRIDMRSSTFKQAVVSVWYSSALFLADCMRPRTQGARGSQSGKLYHPQGGSALNDMFTEVGENAGSMVASSFPVRGKDPLQQPAGAPLNCPGRVGAPCPYLQRANRLYCCSLKHSLVLQRRRARRDGRQPDHAISSAGILKLRARAARDRLHEKVATGLNQGS